MKQSKLYATEDRFLSDPPLINVLSYLEPREQLAFSKVC